MPRPTDDDALGLRQIDGLAGFLERRLGLLADGAGVDRDVERRERAPAPRPWRAWSARNDPTCTVTKCGVVALRDDVGGQLALEHRPHEHRPPSPVLIAVTSVTSARSSRAASCGAKSRV